MTKKFLRGALLAMMSALMIGCATTETQFAIKDNDLKQKLQSGSYVQKVDNFMIILDASSSMDDICSGQTKLNLAKCIVSRMNETLPDLKLTCGLRTFGQCWWPLSKKTTLVHGLTEHSRAAFGEALHTVKWAGGASPLALAIDTASGDLQPTQDEIAVIIVSDGQHMDHTPVEAAQNMKRLFGERLCIYTVLVGSDPVGKPLMEQIAQASRCGFSVHAENIASGRDMADFVEKVFLQRPAPADSDGDGVFDDADKCPNTPEGVRVNRRGCPLDTDRDGVFDYLDQCPGTPRSARVNHKGCWLPESVHFDFDKWNIKPEAYSALDGVVKVLKRNPALKIKVEGHTDNIGSEAYNKKLSEKRASAVVDYCVERGVRAERLHSAGYGFSRPIASNETPEGRAQNRRAELAPAH